MLTISPASVIASKVFALVAEDLDERQRRLLLGAFALLAGRGGITQVAGITGVAPQTVRLGQQELIGQRPSPPNGRVRHAGLQANAKLNEGKQHPDRPAPLPDRLPRRVELHARQSHDPAPLSGSTQSVISRPRPANPTRWSRASR